MNKTDTILEECLNQIQNGVSTLDECMVRYPEQATELASLVRTTARLAHAGEIMPSPVFRARTRTELNAYIQSHPRMKRPTPFVWRLAFNLMTTILAFCVLGTAIAQRSLPGDTLHSWKLTSERVWRAVSIDRLATDLTLSNRRLRELVRVYNDEARRERAVKNHQQMLTRFKSDPNAQHQERIIPVLRFHQESLSQVGISIPELDNYFSPETKDGSGEQDSPDALDPVITVSAFGLVPA
jgi:hypothetical protein